MMRYRISDVDSNVCANAENIPRIVCICKPVPEVYISGFNRSILIFTTFAIPVPAVGNRDVRISVQNEALGCYLFLAEVRRLVRVIHGLSYSMRYSTSTSTDIISQTISEEWIS